MVVDKRVEAAVAILREAVPDSMVVRFGSRARGQACPDSDEDALDKSGVQEAIRRAREWADQFLAG